MVVPKEQSVAIYDNIKRHGGDVEYKLKFILKDIIFVRKKTCAMHATEVGIS